MKRHKAKQLNTLYDIYNVSSLKDGMNIEKGTSLKQMRKKT